MNRSTVLAAALTVVLLPTTLLGSDRLLFEMAGARNGAMPDFSIAPGRVSETTRDTIYVTGATYTSIASLVVNIGSRAPAANKLMFSVTEYSNSAQKHALFIPNKAVGNIMRRIILMCHEEGRVVPKVVSEIADSLPPAG